MGKGVEHFFHLRTNVGNGAGFDIKPQRL